jgi:hypothetical protein
VGPTNLTRTNFARGDSARTELWCRNLEVGNASSHHRRVTNLARGDTTTGNVELTNLTTGDVSRQHRAASQGVVNQTGSKVIGTNLPTGNVARDNRPTGQMLRTHDTRRQTGERHRGIAQVP